MSSTKLIVALDYPNRTDAQKLMSELQGLDVIYKLGLELFVAQGPEFVRSVVQAGHKVFLDLKLHDIPNTVANAALRGAELGVHMMTFHVQGGPKMIAATREIFEKNKISAKNGPLLLGVTVLTSFDQSTFEQVHGACPPLNEVVSRYAKNAQLWGYDGVVCSPHEVKGIAAVAPGFKTVVPGIRPLGTATDDQARVMTPAQAHQAGAYAVVVGRPITQAKDPRVIAQQILEELKS